MTPKKRGEKGKQRGREKLEGERERGESDNVTGKWRRKRKARVRERDGKKERM